MKFKSVIIEQKSTVLNEQKIENKFRKLVHKNIIQHKKTLDKLKNV
jgi:hypothetical protein